jgi:hypothetical protein
MIGLKNPLGDRERRNVMKANCWYGKRNVQVVDVPDPKILNKRDAIVKVTSTAICGSDLHLYNGFIPTMEKGDIMGHEFMGEIDVMRLQQMLIDNTFDEVKAAGAHQNPPGERERRRQLRAALHSSPMPTIHMIQVKTWNIPSKSMFISMPGIVSGGMRCEIM